MHFIPAILWTIIIFVLCLLPGDKLPEDPIVNADKVYHAGAFALMALLYAFAFKGKNISYGNWLAFIITIVVGGLIEILQSQVSRNRHGDWLDFLFDSLGAMVAVLMYIGWLKYQHRKSKYKGEEKHDGGR